MTRARAGISRREAIGLAVRAGAGTLAALKSGVASARDDDQFGGVSPTPPPPDSRFEKPPTWEWASTTTGSVRSESC